LNRFPAEEDIMRRTRRWIIGGGVAVAGTAVVLARPGTSVSRRVRRAFTHAGSSIRYAEGRLEGTAYHLRGRRPDPDVTDNTLADRIRSRLGRTEQGLDLPHIHVMVEHHVALLHGAVGDADEADRIERAVAAVPGVAGVESYLHVGLGSWDTRPSEGRAVPRRSPAMDALMQAAGGAGVSPEAAPMVVRGVLATFADRLPAANRAHLSANLPADVRPLFTPPRRIRGAPPARSLRDLVGRVLVTTPEVTLEQVQQVTAAVVHALRELAPGDEKEIASVLPPELRELWEARGRGATEPVE
jgi:uncharacterized protein (DUF2267 family)